MTRPEDAFRRDLGMRLRGYRTQAGLTQQAVAEKVGVSRPTYVNIEAHGEGVSAYRLGQLAHLFGVTADALIRGPIPPSKKVPVQRPPLLTRIVRAFR
jgi:transcriptional regulator with XRE-family HTH domain